MAHLDTGLMEEHISLSHTDMQTLTHYVHERLCACVCENKKDTDFVLHKTQITRVDSRLYSISPAGKCGQSKKNVCIYLHLSQCCVVLSC